ncbi:DUF5665 domain-containing protein [Salisediminibacterium halotolerans]|uniref:Uncharacterized protein n=1 Tax=Salisediminibacterium halotolerans TaxID=517425 RepID=A0A1H9VWC9_9BACI|nr:MULTISPECIES: DUF5665 domain-containing protein [Salisediminibacterium]RLJ71786.1 hypothetical protein BCL39_2459 [Actinophytocola xinjiangensis]RPE86936.1 hypothetical protein EDD67_1800 [Salisediminibacterium halotolerans]TWG32999.1 hypothetical protein BCL52_2454 [Salisediminibacterium halotolerans]SES25829.1 hypothetical protein SAMN05444126_12432 [Salisediminibacterium haloalkalitolerans]GEL08606.1 hypothetical protein SHA02_20220 [Salisediminibacterium halotolerans]
MSVSRDQEEKKIQSKTRGDQKRQEENERFETLLDKLEEMTTKGRLKDMAYHFTNKKEVIKTNLIAGVARGVGLTLGTAIVLGLLFYILSQAVSLPLVGQWIAEFLDMIQQYQNGADVAAINLKE